MRCLVVNAYQNQSKGQARFEEFLGILRPILLHYDKASKLIVRPYTELDDMVYAPDMPAAPGAKAGDRKAGLRQFDTIDFLFVDGDEDLLPWLPEAANLFALVRIAFQTGKCMFSTIQGTQTMCYVNALGGEMLNVVNGRGQRLDDIRATDTADPMLRELFDSVDEDGGGDLDRDEIVAVVKLLYSNRGLSRSKKQVRFEWFINRELRCCQVELEVDEIMEKFDDGGGTIDFEEFTMMVEEMEAFKKSGHRRLELSCYIISSVLVDQGSRTRLRSVTL